METIVIHVGEVEESDFEILREFDSVLLYTGSEVGIQQSGTVSRDQGQSRRKGSVVHSIGGLGASKRALNKSSVLVEM